MKNKFYKEKYVVLKLYLFCRLIYNSSVFNMEEILL